MISWQDLCKRPLGNLLSSPGLCTRSPYNKRSPGKIPVQDLYKSSVGKCTWTFHKSHLSGNLQEKAGRGSRGQRFCVSLRSRNAHGHFTIAILCGKFIGNWPDTDDTTSIEHRALTLTVRTPQCGHTGSGKMVMFHSYVSLPESIPRYKLRFFF